jgi:hypothetical protein
MACFKPALHQQTVRLTAPAHSRGANWEGVSPIIITLFHFLPFRLTVSSKVEIVYAWGLLFGDLRIVAYRPRFARPKC